MSRARRLAPPLLLILALAATFALPAVTRDEYVLAFGVSFATFAVLAAGLNLVWGYTGLLSFAQVGFFGIGGYTAALLATELLWSVWAGAAAGGLLATLAGLLVAYSALRLSRHAFAIVSLSFALLCLVVARDWVALTRGPMGIPGLPVPTLSLPGLTLRFADPASFFRLMLGFAVAAHAAIWVVVSSRLGRAMKAIRMNETLAQSQGIDPLRYKLLAIALSALLSGIAGGLFVFYLTIVDPSIFDFYYTETMLIMVIMGGPGSFWGVLLSSAVFTAIPDLLRFSTDLRMVLYGALLVVAMLVMPGGVGGWLRQRRLRRLRRQRAPPARA